MPAGLLVAVDEGAGVRMRARDGSVEKRWSGRPTEQWLADSIEEQL